jgi:NADH:ubiquinone oxidoreductase subunit 3 (subunit A)
MARPKKNLVKNKNDSSETGLNASGRAELSQNEKYLYKTFGILFIIFVILGMMLAQSAIDNKPGGGLGVGIIMLLFAPIVIGSYIAAFYKSASTVMGNRDKLIKSNIYTLLALSSCVLIVLGALVFMVVIVNN